MRSRFARVALAVCLLFTSAFCIVISAVAQPTRQTPIATDNYQAFAETVKSGASIWFGSDEPTTRVQMVRVSQLLKDPNLYASDAAALAAIFRYMRSKKLSEVDLGSILSDRSQIPSEYRTTCDIVQRGMALYGTHQNPVMDSIKHGRLADCYLIPAIASVIERDPGRIKSMIKTGSSPNEYVVSFPGAQSSVHVRMTPGMVAALPVDASDDGLWLPLIILADSASSNSGVVPNVLYSDIATGTAAKALRLLTGREFNEQPLTHSTPKEIAQILASAEKTKSPVIVHSHGRDLCLVAYAPKTSTVTLSNPWGGRVALPLSKFMTTFVGITSAKSP